MIEHRVPPGKGSTTPSWHTQSISHSSQESCEDCSDLRFYLQTGDMTHTQGDEASNSKLTASLVGSPGSGVMRMRSFFTLTALRMVSVFSRLLSVVTAPGYGCCWGPCSIIEAARFLGSVSTVFASCVPAAEGHEMNALAAHP